MQSLLDYIFILLLAKGACGVDETLQRGEGERVAQSPLLEPCQGM